MANQFSQFDLYDFFSVLLPGILFLTGLLLFAPDGTKFTSIGLILPIITGGYVAGRFLHVIAVETEGKYRKVVSHREKFRKEVYSPTLIDEKVMTRFLESCTSYFDLDYGLPVSQEEIKEEINELEIDAGLDDRSILKEMSPEVRRYVFYTKYGIKLKKNYKTKLCDEQRDSVLEEIGNVLATRRIDRQIDSVYGLARGRIHMDSRGRSRTFQAIFAFYRSTWMGVLLLGLLYSTFAIGSQVMQNYNIRIPIIPYKPIIAGIESISIGVVLLDVLFILALSYFSFGRAKDRYRDYFLQYLVADFLQIQQETRQQEQYDVSISEIPDKIELKHN